MTYKYQFQDTHHIIEIEESISASPKLVLINPTTQRLEDVKRLCLGGCGCIFLGDGWTPKHYGKDK